MKACVVNAAVEYLTYGLDVFIVCTVAVGYTWKRFTEFKIKKNYQVKKNSSPTIDRAV